MEPKKSIDAASSDDWQKVKQAQSGTSQDVLKVDHNLTLQQFDYPLALNKDGTLSFYWFDAHEENNGQDLYLFGKVW
jgi:hypothetical protein